MEVKEFVEEVLKENEEARNDDFVLCLNVYVKMGYAKKQPLGVLIEYANIEFAPAFETITRIRREIQNNEGRLTAREDVEERRQKRREETHAYYSGKNASYVTMKNSWMS